MVAPEDSAFAHAGNDHSQNKQHGDTNGDDEVMMFEYPQHREQAVMHAYFLPQRTVLRYPYDDLIPINSLP